MMRFAEPDTINGLIALCESIRFRRPCTSILPCCTLPRRWRRSTIAPIPYGSMRTKGRWWPTYCVARVIYAETITLALDSKLCRRRRKWQRWTRGRDRSILLDTPHRVRLDPGARCIELQYGYKTVVFLTFSLNYVALRTYRVINIIRRRIKRWRCRWNSNRPTPPVAPGKRLIFSPYSWGFGYGRNVKSHNSVGLYERECTSTNGSHRLISTNAPVSKITKLFAVRNT